MSIKGSLLFLFLFLSFPALFLCTTKEPDYKPRNITDLRTSFFSAHSENFYKLDKLIPDGYNIAGSVVLPFKDKDGKVNKMTDLILYTSTDSVFHFYAQLYDADKASFGHPIEIFSLDASPGFSFSNLFVGGILRENFDKVDYIVSFSSSSSSSFRHFLVEHSFAAAAAASGGGGGGEVILSKLLDISSRILIGDFDGDRNLEILFRASSRRVLKVLRIGRDELQSTELEFSSLRSNDTKLCFRGNEFDDKEIGVQRAFVDLNGDCVSDLILSHSEGQKTIIEIYLGKKEGVDYEKMEFGKGKVVYCFSEKIEVEGRFGGIEVYDLEHLGVPSLFLPLINSNELLYFKNKLKLTYKWDLNFCEEHLNVNSNFSALVFSAPIKIKMPDTNNMRFYSEFDSVIRLGDYEGSLRAGILAAFEDEKGGKNVRLFRVKEREKKEKEKKYEEKKYEEKNIKNNIEIYGDEDIFESDYLFKDGIFGAFFDVDEDGVLDLLIQYSNSSSFFFFNKLQSDKYFIKAKLMSSLPKSSRPKNDSFARYFATEPGACFYFYVTNSEGERELTFASQLSVTSGHALQTPFAITGIGRSNNYIENLVTVSNSFDMQRLSPKKFSWKEGDVQLTSPVIPNTQLMISKLSDNNSLIWEIELIVQPTDKLILLVVIVAIVLIIVLVFIGYLHYKEVQEEEEEAKTFTTWFG